MCVCVCVKGLIFLTTLSFDGHLGCFQVLAIVHNAATNTGMHVSFQVRFLFSLDRYPGVELLDHMVVPLLVF